MSESVLNNKKLLIVDDEPDILDVVQETILEHSPDTKVDKANKYETAAELLKTEDYDLVILDIMGVRGFDLLEIATKRKFKVVMLTAHALNSEALKKSHDKGAMGYIPKAKLETLVPLIEDLLQNDYKTGWQRLMSKLESFFDASFEPEWKTKAGIRNWW
ncbi:MAG TPA: response regulator [Syntrophorhabdaceae bacterium]|nr:response regulator [Syntrophorhabdaceae bacterium]